MLSRIDFWFMTWPRIAIEHTTIQDVGWFDLRQPATWDLLVLNDSITYPLLQQLRHVLGYTGI